MIRNIRHGCGHVLGWFDDATGCLRDPALPEGVKVWGVYILCLGCGRYYKFDGLRLRKKERAREERKEEVKKAA
jgi:hypothetical protein